MKVLMFGWEFPPHISGGLGTASFGLTKGLAQFKDIEVLFVVPKAYGDEDDTAVKKIIGANEITITRKHVNIKNTDKQIDISEVSSNLVPYCDPEEFWQFTQQRLSSSTRFVQTDAHGKIPFSGKYGANLHEEIANYAIVAEYIGREYDFDVIHAHDWLAYPAGIAAKR